MLQSTDPKSQVTRKAEGECREAHVNLAVKRKQNSYHRWMIGKSGRRGGHGNRMDQVGGGCRKRLLGKTTGIMALSELENYCNGNSQESMTPAKTPRSFFQWEIQSLNQPSPVTRQYVR